VEKPMNMFSAEVSWIVDPGKTVTMKIPFGPGEDETVMIVMDWNTACLFRQAFNDIMQEHMPEKEKHEKTNGKV
jgi:hypothetical protein